MSYDLFSYACLNTVGSVAHFVTAIAFVKECGMNSCGMNAECLTDAQTQKHKFFCRALAHLKMLEKRERLGITLVHITIPARSRDFNPVEHIFHIVKMKLY